MKIYHLIRHWEINDSRGNKTLERTSTTPQELVRWIKKVTPYCHEGFKWNVVMNFHADMNLNDSDGYNPYIHLESSSLDEVERYFDSMEGHVPDSRVYLHGYKDGNHEVTYEISMRTLH